MIERPKLTILGSSSATPTASKFPTAQVLDMRGRLFLIDCGEGTQVQMRRFSVPFQKISRIFISHLHGDHFFGLPGLLSSFHLMNRQTELHLHGPEALWPLLKSIFAAQGTYLVYPLVFHPIPFDQEGVVFEDEQLTVHSIFMKHSIACSGFVFREKELPRKLIPERITEFQIPWYDCERIKRGEDFTLADGTVILNDRLTRANRPAASYAFFSDTMFQPHLADAVRSVSLMYHEATFMEADADLAIKTNHSTTRQAAEMAKLSDAGKLLIGHFSARYREEELILAEAREGFPNTEMATEGLELEF